MLLCSVGWVKQETLTLTARRKHVPFTSTPLHLRYLNTFNVRPVASRKPSSVAKATVIIATRIQILPGVVSAVCHSSLASAARQSATPISETQRLLCVSPASLVAKGLGDK